MMANVTDAELVKFTREEYRQIVDLFTETNANLSFFLDRFDAKFKARFEAADAGAVVEENRPDGVGDVPVAEILAFRDVIRGLKAALPTGTTDTFLARRVRAMKVQG